MTSKEIFDLGYAISMYSIAEDLQWFRYRDETFKLPTGMVELHDIGRLDFKVAKIEDVRAAVQ